MKIRRIVFGEPKPGGSDFAKVLGGLGESVSYCNRVGPLEHDRVTDLPFTVPALGLNFQHPTALYFVSAAPADNDEYGIFAEHHAPLYYEGAQTAMLDPVHVEAARLCDAIYARPGAPTEAWDMRFDTAGVAWGIKFDGDRAYVVFRGSDDLLDWLRDLTALDPFILAQQLVQHDSFGLMWDGFLDGMPETWIAIKRLIARATEVVITGHSLGAARADVACGYALIGA